MSTEQSDKEISHKEFMELKDALAHKLSSQLSTEILMSEFENELQEEDPDLWDTPTVDSKAVMKLSPIVEGMTGRKIKPEWIKAGGYDSVEDAINDVIKQLELDFKNSETEQNDK